MSSNGGNPSSSWILATTQPNIEFTVSDRLERRGFQHHVFKVQGRRVKRGRLVSTLVPAFPRYIFAQIPPNRWGEFFDQIEGIVSFVRNGDGGPARIAVSVVEELLARAPNGVLPEEPKRCPFQPNERVIVRGTGITAGYAAKFEHALPGGQAIVLMEWMQRWVQLQVALDDLDKAEKPRGRRSHRRRRKRGHRAGRKVQAMLEAAQ